MTVRSAFLIFLCATSFASCASPATTTQEKLLFVPPIGWTGTIPASAPPADLIGVWRTDESELSISRVKRPHEAIERTGTQLTGDIRKVYGASNLIRSATYPVCHGRTKGWFVEFKDMHHAPLRAMTVVVPGNMEAIVVTYTRPEGSPQRKDAIAAIQSVCFVNGR